MEETTLQALTLTAAVVGVVHTATGPDHFLPFIAMSRAGGWSLRKTMFITSACGMGHVLSSVVLGLAGFALGTALGRLEIFEAFRGSVAGWLLFGFGLAYLVWGLRRAWRKRAHDAEHAHLHLNDHEAGVVGPWIVFLIFVFGPCEPLIPLLYPAAAEASLAGSVLVAGVFGLATLSTMLAMVAAGYLGLARFASGSMQRYAHAICGGAIAACGAAVVFGL